MKNLSKKQKIYLGIGVGFLLLSGGLIAAKIIKDKKNAAKEVLENDVNFNEVEIGMKLQKSEQTNKLSPYYYLRVQGKFKRYIKVSELL